MTFTGSGVLLCVSEMYTVPYIVDVYLGLVHNMMLDDAGANVSVYKNSFVAQTGTWLLK